ncbi:aminotransferase class IV [Parachlamydia sp. AcF125]|uniref:aminotransferase class IV n=1 Tax=Parachlamydia sp. AcF125 TaxID=2795736 RepID=UPI001BCA157B|nr:aminotransferase class IV [Parachlamydia sp. AcF125]MBS4168819.1 Aminodeoxychorismate lyase [Parachlamydia sp. AcF125]
MYKAIYFNGQFYPADAPLFTAKERSFLYGDGFFTSIRLLNGEATHLSLHFERLKKSAEALNISFASICTKAIQKLIFLNQAETGLWKLKIIITGGDTTPLMLHYRQGKVLMTLAPYEAPPFQPLSLGLFPEPILRPFARYKTLSYLDQLAVKHMALVQGVDDMLILSSKNELLETAFSNIFWMHEKTLYTPSPELPLLYGVGLQSIEKMVVKKDWKIQYGAYRLEEIPVNAQVYVCNALMGFRPIIQIASRVFVRDPSLEHLLNNKQ